MVLPIIGALVGGAASLGAAAIQNRAGRRQERLQRRIYEQNRENFQPYLEGGQNALSALLYEMGLGEGPEGYGGFRETPGYQFRFREGQRAVDASKAAQGGFVSGSTLQALQERGQNLAAQEYANYYNRLAGLAAGGQASAGQQAAAGNAYAAGAGRAIANQGNALSAGLIGAGNAVQGGIENYLGYQQFNRLLDLYR